MLKKRPIITLGETFSPLFILDTTDNPCEIGDLPSCMQLRDTFICKDIDNFWSKLKIFSYFV